MGKQYTIVIDCAECERTFPVTADIDGFQRWIDGELIQRALPELSVEDRELLISQTCGECFTDMFELPD